MSDIVHQYWRATTPAREKREDGYALIADLYRAGLSFDAIQEKLGCGRNMIGRALTAHNVERRPRAKPEGVPNRNKTVIRKRNAQRVAKRRVDCARCGWLLADKPGCIEGLCALCCEDVARGVVYAGESFDVHVRWGATMMRKGASHETASLLRGD